MNPGQSRRWGLRAGLALALLAGAAVAGVLEFMPRPAAQQQAQPAPRPGAGAPIPVSTAPVVNRDVPVLLSGLGSVQPYRTVLVRARVDGTLDQVNFTEGQMVRPGELLAQIDPRPYQAALNAAVARKAADEADLANARLDLERYASLLRSDFASRQKVDTQKAMVARMQAALAADEAAIATARLNLEFTRITAPFAGRVGLRQVDQGNLIRAGDQQGIVSVAQVRPISVVFTLPQDQLPRIQDAMAQRRLKAYAYGGDERSLLGEGELLTPDNAIDPGTGTIRLKATFPNDDGRLWPGQFVNVRLLLDTLPQVATVPSAAVMRGPEGLYVYQVRPDSTVVRQHVELRQDDGRTAVIQAALKPGDQVVTGGQSRLQSGARVAPGQIQPAQAAPPGGTAAAGPGTGS